MPNKRFHKEILCHKNMTFNTNSKSKWNSEVENCFYIDNTDETVSFCIMIESKSYIVKIDISQSLCYPFRSPDVYINNHNYKSLLRHNSLMEKYKTYLDYPVCMCCNSILCEWGPIYGITHILKEIRKNLTIKIRLTYMIISEKVMLKHFGFIIPIIYEFV